MNLEEAPEEPHLHSEPHLLSPASPKPIHFPAPTNIPVLNNMMDVSFNQTELHMQDPSMRNTELREGAWKETEEPREAAGDERVLLAATNEPVDGVNEQSIAANIPMTHDSHDTSLATDAALLNAQDDELAKQTDQAVTNTDVTTTTTTAADDNSLHAHAPTPGTSSMSIVDGSALSETQAQPSNYSLPSNVDVQSLLASLQAAPSSVAPTSNTPVAPAQQDASVSESVADATIPVSTPVTTLGDHGSAQSQDYHQTASTPASSAADQLGNDLVSALARGFTQARNTPVELPAAFVGTSSTPLAQVAANGIIQSRAPSSQRERKIAAGEPVTEEDMPWTADIQQKYDAFIQEERKYVNDGKWDQFPHGSRLFVGNLSSESVTKRDIFHVFHIYGDLAQISIKQAYGFVQFLNADDCARALGTEQGRPIRDKRIHLEISKPQKSRNQQNNNRNRSRSPGNRGSGRSGNQYGRSDRDSSYRALRSPTPPRGGYRDRYDDRQRKRSRSPPGYGRIRYGRSPSPGARDIDDDLPLPKRSSQDVPDIQVIVRDNLSKDFIQWVEKVLIGRGLRAAVLLLDVRLSEEAVIRRQLLEGVLAIVRLDRQAQDTGKINLRVFNRSRGAHNVTFDDYENLDPSTCAELVLRAKSTHLPAPLPPQYGNIYQQAPSYAQPLPPQYGYGAPSAPPQPPGYPSQYSAQQPTWQPGLQPGLQPPNIDMGSLQNLLATARNGGQQQMAAPQTVSAPYSYPAQQVAAYGNVHQQQQQQTQEQVNYQNWLQQQRPATGLRSEAPPTVPQYPPPAGAVNMQDILARLGSYNK